MKYFVNCNTLDELKNDDVMTNKEKATHVLAIIMEELNMPNGSTIGDVAYALSIIDPDETTLNILKLLIRDAVIDDIKEKIS